MFPATDALTPFTKFDWMGYGGAEAAEITDAGVTYRVEPGIAEAKTEKGYDLILVADAKGIEVQAIDADGDMPWVRRIDLPNIFIAYATAEALISAAEPAITEGKVVAVVTPALLTLWGFGAAFMGYEYDTAFCADMRDDDPR